MIVHLIVCDGSGVTIYWLELFYPSDTWPSRHLIKFLDINYKKVPDAVFAQHDSPTPVASRDVVASQTKKKIGIVLFKHDERIILIEYF